MASQIPDLVERVEKLERQNQRLKEIGTRARHDIEAMLGHRCHLELFVKVEKDWRERAHLLDEMGIKQ